MTLLLLRSDGRVLLAAFCAAHIFGPLAGALSAALVIGGASNSDDSTDEPPPPPLTPSEVGTVILASAVIGEVAGLIIGAFNPTHQNSVYRVEPRAIVATPRDTLR